MDVSNWLYLGVGLAIGAGLRSLFLRSQQLDNSSSNALVGGLKAKKAPVSDTKEDLQKVLDVPQSLDVQSFVSNGYSNNGLFNSFRRTDVTHVNQEETKFAQKLKQTELAYEIAREMSLFKAGFLARTTHELRSPLNGMINLHQLILSDLCENPEEEREFIALAHDRSLKLLKMLDDVLKIARIEYGTNKLEIHPVQLSQVLQEVYDLTRMLAANRNYPLNFLLPESDIYVLADPLWLKQVLLNFINASIAHMENGSISISTAISSDLAYIWLDLPTHSLCLSEPVDLITSNNKQSQTYQEKPTLSPGIKLLLNQTLLELMGGKLEILEPDTIQSSLEDASQALSRIQISIPLVVPEIEFQPLEMKVS